MLYRLIDDHQSVSARLQPQGLAVSLLIHVIWVRKAQTSASLSVDRVISAAPLEVEKAFQL